MKNKKIEEAMTQDEIAPPVRYIRTGCDLLDILLGGKKNVYGIQAGTILGILGESGSGKSFFINEMVAASHYRDPENFRWVISDGENGNKFDTKKLYGLELSSEDKIIEGFAKDEKTGKKKSVSIKFHHSTTVQEMDAHLSLFLSGLKDNEYAVYAQDSLNSISDANAEEEQQERLTKLVAGKKVEDKGSYKTGKQKFLSEFFAGQVDNLERKNCLFIVTSQYRDKIGSIIPGQKSVPGGRALKYYCNTIVDLSIVYKIEVGGLWIGSVVKARTKNKARTERPGREIYYNVYFTRGIDNVGSNIDFLFDLRGDNGQLKSDEVVWGGVIPDLKTVEAWLEETGKLAEYKEFAYRVLGRRTINLDVVYQWAKEGIPKEKVPPACPEAYDQYFGKKMTRDELRALCGSNIEERKKLRKLVIEKWEAKEDEAAKAVGFQKTFDNFD
jgi:RecA/RadA recombinase